MFKSKSLLPAGLMVLATISVYQANGQIKELHRFKVPEAKQAVAVDKNFFYVINSSTITRHDKKTGSLLAKWDGAGYGVKHLNSGVMIRGKLYCATSNYPDSPMASSIEIFDPVSLRHIGNHSFGIFIGSATWIDLKDGFWYVGFAHYSSTGSSEGKDTRWTSVVKFTRKWQQVEAWIFPEEIIKEFSPKSNSGGTWGSDGKLYCTGHDADQLYVFEIPQTGYTLNLIKTIKAPIEGQGIAFDRSEKNRMVMYGINRNENLVNVFEISQDQAPDL